MPTHKKSLIITESGEQIDAQVPVIVSASRSTDIPAFYADWFFHRLEKGYSAWTNPFNGKRTYVSYEDTRLIVFWSKNPKPLLPHISKLKAKNINTYIQFSINNYEKEGLELGIPKLEERIDTFKQLVDMLGKGHIVWRNDPLLLTDNITQEVLLERIQYTAEKLKGYAEKLVFSFIDIEDYRKVKNNLSKLEVACREFTVEEMTAFASSLAKLNQQWNYELATCGEKIDLQSYGISNNKCIDDILIAKLFSHDKALMQYIGYIPIERQLSLFDSIDTNTETNFITKPPKETGQREACGCIKSKDIGEYNTCPHLCEYCYANNSKTLAEKNYKLHLQFPLKDNITGK